MSRIVKRTLDIFELFEERQAPLALSEVARALEIPVSSCHDVLKTLEERGYVYQLGPRAGYYPTGKLAILATEITENDPFMLRAEQAMRDLSSRYGCSVFLARIEGATARYIELVEAQGPWRYSLTRGATLRSLHSTSAGKAVLGNLPEDERRKVVAGLRLDLMTPNTITDADRLLKDLGEGRRQGWYLNQEESVPTATTLSVTLRWGQDDYVLTMAGPSHVLDAMVDDLAATLRRVADRLEAPR